MITSTHNPKLKLIRALQGRAKERRDAGAFLVEGVRLVEEAVNSNWGFRFALYNEDLSERGMSQVETLKSRGVDCEMVSTSLMKSLSETETPQGILAVLELAQLPTLAPGASAGVPNYRDFILIPDQIRDPGNLGTLLRTAAAAGVQAVLLPPETTDAYAPKVVRSGMGAHFHLPIHSMSWDEIDHFIAGSATHPRLQVFLADMDGQACWETDLRQPVALIIGGEADGASESARKLTNQKICIPMPEKIESLNAGVAGSILMFEVVRQRNIK